MKHLGLQHPAYAVRAFCGALLCTTADVAFAQASIEAGLDAGISIADPELEFVDPNVERDNPIPTLALGIQVAMSYLFTPELGLGLAIAPAFFTAGHNHRPGAGLNLVFAPQVTWHPGIVRFTLSTGVLGFSWSDPCVETNTERSKGCELVQQHEAAAVGFAGAFAAMFRVADLGYGALLDVGPSVRLQVARFNYEELPGSFLFPLFQGTLAARFYLDLGDESFNAPTP